MNKTLSALGLTAAMALSLTACGGSAAQPSASAPADTSAPAATNSGAVSGGAGEDGVFTVGMECAYAPYNWLQMDDSNGAVPLADGSGYANGYDVMIAKKIAEANGWELQIVSSAWDSLTPAVQAGTMDANIAGQSMTAERMQEVDMAGPYYYATIVCVTTKESPYATASSIQDLAGGKCTAQSGTIWYDSCLPQIPDADVLAPADTAPAMLMQLETGTVDYVCTDMPTAMGAVAKNDDLVILNFSGTDGDFQFASEEERAENVNIGIAVKKGNTELKDAIDSVLSTMSEDDFNALMDEAIQIQPEV
ncbi:transporter substrate-binding domain-containing protein [Pseudoflavonifractor sp. MSJ-37]|uniref:transporter substrate-binding domain-containing protein n=1 Tax=Pseudoflavonifractor sp. MSJ-37 TaxID=2841531 RepID=UPI001C12200E|nr:transporter substrate-binding domain-containing protein [Pseudoflavonifractor sp. MSJ-37]MBU5435201.1 transporter substrate-binding domain-containing protein [Pseudoflavonifractor sp. MSJ-37]